MATTIEKPKATEKQVAFINALLSERVVMDDASRFLLRHPNGWDHPETLTKGQASWLITLLLGCPRKHRN